MKSSHDTISCDLKARGLRATPQRLAVLAAASGLSGYFTPQGLHESLKNSQAAIGLTTVYRTLEVLEHAGLLCRLEGAGDERIYAYCSRVHHHHLTCDSCAQVVELGDCVLAGLVGQLECETGFAISSHSLEFRGLCRACRLKAKNAQERGLHEKT